MTPEQWERIDRVWHAVMGESPQDRAAAIARLCGDDAALKRDVESLFTHLSHASAAGFGTAPKRRAAPLARGTRLGPYEVVEHIGAGGMGDVYRGRDHRLNRSVAIKVLPPDFMGGADPSTPSNGARSGSNPDRLRRFEAEARAAAALNHPNIVAIHDVGRLHVDQADISFIVTELLEGRTLRQVISDEKLSIARAIDVASQIADGLAAAHARGIVHRDLKPENI